MLINEGIIEWTESWNAYFPASVTYFSFSTPKLAQKEEIHSNQLWCKF